MNKVFVIRQKLGAIHDCKGRFHVSTSEQPLVSGASKSRLTRPTLHAGYSVWYVAPCRNPLLSWKARGIRTSDSMLSLADNSHLLRNDGDV
jgi:hypothetical protein